MRDKNIQLGRWQPALRRVRACYRRVKFSPSSSGEDESISVSAGNDFKRGDSVQQEVVTLQTQISAIMPPNSAIQPPNSATQPQTFKQMLTRNNTTLFSGYFGQRYRPLCTCWINVSKILILNLQLFKRILEHTLCLLGSANAQLSILRRKKVLASTNKNYSTSTKCQEIAFL